MGNVLNLSVWFWFNVILTIFQSYHYGLLKYEVSCASRQERHDTPPSHNIQKPGWPVLAYPISLKDKGEAANTILIIGSGRGSNS